MKFVQVELARPLEAEAFRLDSLRGQEELIISTIMAAEEEDMVVPVMNWGDEPMKLYAGQKIALVRCIAMDEHPKEFSKRPTTVKLKTEEVTEAEKTEEVIEAKKDEQPIPPELRRRIVEKLATWHAS